MGTILFICSIDPVGFKRQKKQCKSLEEEITLMDIYKYEPIGVLCHLGSSQNNGHYITHMKTPSGQWILYDDTYLSVSSLVHDDDDDDYY